MGMIKIDYDKALRQANRLQGAAGECESSNREVEKVLQKMYQCWQGEAAKQFELQLLNWKKEQKLIISELNELSKSIKIVANDFKKTEESLAAAYKSGGGGFSRGGGGQGSFGGGSNSGGGR